MTCNTQRGWSYTAPLGHAYTKLEGFRQPFEQVSLDPLDYWRIQAFPISRKVIKNYPLAIKRLNCLKIVLMEDMSTEQVLLGLLRFGSTIWKDLNDNKRCRI